MYFEHIVVLTKLQKFYQANVLKRLFETLGKICGNIVKKIFG